MAIINIQIHSFTNYKHHKEMRPRQILTLVPKAVQGKDPPRIPLYTIYRTRMSLIFRNYHVQTSSNPWRQWHFVYEINLSLSQYFQTYSKIMLHVSPWSFMILVMQIWDIMKKNKWLHIFLTWANFEWALTNGWIHW